MAVKLKFKLDNQFTTTKAETEEAEKFILLKYKFYRAVIMTDKKIH